MLTIRDDSLSLDYLRTKPNSEQLAKTILTNESFEVWDNTPVSTGMELLNDAVKRATGADLHQVIGLVEILDEYESALTYDLLVMGLKLRLLGTQEFSWGELLAIVQNSPRSSAFYRAQHPDQWMWTEAEHLLAAIADAQHLLLWQNGSGKRADRPKPIQRPGVVTDEVKTFGKDPIPYDEMADWLGGQFSELSSNTNT